MISDTAANTKRVPTNMPLMGNSRQVYTAPASLYGANARLSVVDRSSNEIEILVAGIQTQLDVDLVPRLETVEAYVSQLPVAITDMGADIASNYNAIAALGGGGGTAVPPLLTELQVLVTAHKGVLDVVRSASESNQTDLINARNTIIGLGAQVSQLAVMVDTLSNTTGGGGTGGTLSTFRELYINRVHMAVTVIANGLTQIDSSTELPFATPPGDPPAYPVSTTTGSGFFHRATDTAGTSHLLICTNVHVVVPDYTYHPGEIYIGPSGTVVLDANVASEVYCVVTEANGIANNTIVVACDVLGLDRTLDIAILRPQSPATNPRFGYTFTASQTAATLARTVDAVVRPGDWCCTIGTPRPDPSQPDPCSIAVGVVRDPKLFNRVHPCELISCDFTVYPGNSGGMLLSDSGEVIGMLNSTIGDSQFVLGPNADVLYDSIQVVLRQQLLRNALPPLERNPLPLDTTGRVYLGIEQWRPYDALGVINQRKNMDPIVPLAQTPIRGLEIVTIDSTSPRTYLDSRVSSATPQVLQVGDVIMAIEGVESSSSSTLRHVVGEYYNERAPSVVLLKMIPGETVKLDVMRPSTNMTFTVVVLLDSLPVQHRYLRSLVL
jgi:S1-C subfamily serine protease